MANNSCNNCNGCTINIAVIFLTAIIAGMAIKTVMVIIAGVPVYGFNDNGHS